MGCRRESVERAVGSGPSDRRATSGAWWRQKSDSAAPERNALRKLNYALACTSAAACLLLIEPPGNVYPPEHRGSGPPTPSPEQGQTASARGNGSVVRFRNRAGWVGIDGNESDSDRDTGRGGLEALLSLIRSAGRP
jgi:hypothetical protein